MTIKLKFVVTKFEKDTLPVSPLTYLEIMNSSLIKSDSIKIPQKAILK